MVLEDRIRLPNLSLIQRRSRLLNLLEKFVAEGQRLITIYAPGGYGKSILLADFAQTTDLPVCWCSLASVDRDPTTFLTLLAYSITDRFHEIDPEGLLKLVAQGNTQNSIHRIAELLKHVGPHIIIVDDYHKAVSAGMTLALNRLLDQLPPTSTMIVAARGDMTLETGQIIDLLISERATGLSEEELRFTGEEVKLVMRKRFGRQIDLTRAEEIAQATDGNIAQILLTGHIMHVDRLIGRLRQQLGDDQAIIYDYLATEVFGKQPPELQRFMLYTSVLPDMTPALCNALLDICDAQDYLQELVRKDLFIAQFGAGFRYHDLFAEFLRARLGKDEALHRQVCLKAAQLLAQQNYLEESISLFLSVQAWDEAAVLLEAEGWSFRDTGRVLTLNQWLIHIPEEELLNHPRLLLLRGLILNDNFGDSKLAMTLFQQAEAQFLQQNDLIGVAEAQIFQSVGLRMMGQARKGLTLAIRGVAQLESLNPPAPTLAWALKQRGHAYGIAGDISEALSDLRRALASFEALNDTYRIGVCHHDIGVFLEKQGNINGATHHFKQAVRIWETLGNANDLANTLNSLGVSLHTIGQYDEALTYFTDSLDIALSIGADRRAAFVQAGIGDTYLDQQEYTRALAAYNISTEFARKANVQSLEIYNQVKVGECFYQQGQLDEALRLSSQAREIAAEVGLTFEKGLACTLQAKIYVQRAEYSASFRLFEEAVTCFSNNDILELTKVRLWWGYNLFLDYKTAAAFEQIKEAISLALGMGDLIRGLGSTVTATFPVLHYFFHQPGISTGMRDNIQLLLRQSPEEIELSKPSLQVFLFGTPTLIVAGRPKQFHQRGRTRKLPEFLAYLLLENRGTGSRWSEVSAMLWPEEDSDRASNLFHQNLKSFRDVIFTDHDYIVVRDDYYQVNPDYLEWCDALAFERLFERASRVAPAEALALQLELIELYQGPFLSGFEVTEWGATRQTLYETKFLQMVELAGDQLLTMGKPEEALAIINKGLGIDYFHEALHRLAFKAYTQLNLYDHLTTHYDMLRKVFEQEFEAPPDQATVQLYEQLITER
jgi:ATP/maltotriose-dependent transcriptional regulator MalT/DNA-binding SARP family transcriptional activator